jgi:hypothetical protein
VYSMLSLSSGDSEFRCWTENVSSWLTLVDAAAAAAALMSEMQLVALVETPVTPRIVVDCFRRTVLDSSWVVQGQT